MKCDKCNKKIIREKNDIGTGYGVDDKGNKTCYACCAVADKEYMKKHGKNTLYLTIVNNGTSNFAKVTNWPASLVFDYLEYKKGDHNWGLTRYDVWFNFNGHVWHGYTIGDMTQICHCKQTKQLI